MDIVEKIKQRILRFLGLDKLAGNPNQERFALVNDPDDVKLQNAQEARVWYMGNSNDLLAYYTGEAIAGFAHNQIYNRNRANYFWGISPEEANIKRVHSGLPRAIVDTLVSVVGVPKITGTPKCGKGDIDVSKLLNECGFLEEYTERQMPLTLAEGWGAWKVSVGADARVSEWPTVQFYEASDVDFAIRNGKAIGVVFKNYYRQGNKDYLLLETRRINERGNSAIEYELYQLGKNDELKPVPMETVEGLEGLKDVEFPGFKKVLAVPCRFFSDPDNPGYGRSVFAGKIDLFDDIDQSLSQRSQTSRVSTPVEYYSPDVLGRDGNGNPKMPKVYNRQYVQKSGIPDGDGRIDTSIQTTQPNLNLSQYNEEQQALVSMALTGIISPSTLGLGISKRDNAEAQREKEKVTIMTREKIVARETEILRDLAEITTAMKVYMDTGAVPLDEPEISVRFSDFANPSFESQSRTLLPMWQAGAISNEMYVEKLYGEDLKGDDRERELEALASNKAEKARVALPTEPGEEYSILMPNAPQIGQKTPLR